MLELGKLETTGEYMDLREIDGLEMVMGVPQWQWWRPSGHGCVPVVIGVSQWT